MEHEFDCDTNCNWCAWNKPQKTGKKTGGIGNQNLLSTTSLGSILTTTPRGLLEIRGRIKIIQITALLRLALSKEHWREEKPNQLRPGFELWLPIPFSIILIVML